MNDDERARLAFLERRVEQLEARLRSLRVGRRVLLRLLQEAHLEHRRDLTRLEREVAALRARNRRYARRLWAQQAQSREMLHY